MTRALRRAIRAAGVALVAVVCSAHIGSPDAWYEGPAGPYRVLVHVEAPAVVPGIAVVNVRPEGTGIERVTAFVNIFDATGGAPPPDEATPVPGNPGWYRTRLWVMTAGSNSVTVTVRGTSGEGSAVVPLVAVAGRRLDFNVPLAASLIVVGVVLALGIFTIVGAAVRESVLPPGTEPDALRRRRARFAIARAAVVFVLVMTGSAAWWRSEDADFAKRLYHPLATTARVDDDRDGRRFVLKITDSAWTNQSQVALLRARGEGQVGELIEDHGQLMHLFLIAADGRSAFAHLHPSTRDTVAFSGPMPPLPAGRYRVFADIVHASGFTQTLTTAIDVGAPEDSSRWQGGPDDSWALGDSAAPDRARLQDGASLTWDRAGQRLVAGEPANLRFVAAGPDGSGARLEPYLGMAGHAVVVRHDGGVFIHLHPLGTISLAAQQRLTGAMPHGDAAAAAHAMPPVSDTLSFPYAFPQPGSYTVWVQVKRSGKILTASFKAEVTPP